MARSKVTRRTFVKFSLGLLAVPVLQACTPAAPTQAPPPTKAPVIQPTSVPPTTAPAGPAECFGAEGSKITVLGVWSGDEEKLFKQVFQPVLDKCKIEMVYEGTRDLEAVLATRVQGGNPPDISMVPNVGSLAKYKDQLVPLDQVGANLDNYSDSWQALGTVDGRLLGLFVKSDVKSLVWYSPAVFAAKGYAVPATWQEFLDLLDKMAANGDVPLSMGMESEAATGWPGTDWIQDIRLRLAGVEFEDKLAKHQVPWTDPLVKQAWELYGKWATDPKIALGGAKGTVSTGFLDAIYAPFADPPKAMMVKQSGFAGNVIMGQYPDLVFGEDFDFFVLPGIEGKPAAMQVGADAMAVFKDTPAVRAIVAYLTSAEGGKAWAASGFDLSPNTGATGADYTNPISAKKADALAAAPAVSFDTGDLVPGGMGMDELQGVTEYVNGGDLDAILARLEAKAEEVYK